MSEYIGQGVFRVNSGVKIESYAGVAGKKEGDGPLGSHFDKVIEDSHFGKDTWEKAESRFQLEAVRLAVQKAGITKEDIDVICSGDLINQCISSTYGLKELSIPFLEIFGACSTMAEGLIISSLLIESRSAKRTVAVTSSHFSTAERQFRFPLSYGGQRTPTSQWTCTASGAVVLSDCNGLIEVAGCCIGKTADMGISDITNMGSAMAPSASETIKRYLTATSTSPSDYNYIVTGDLGTVGSELLKELLLKQNVDITSNHCDCGCMIFDTNSKDTQCGGSGCGCSASVLCSYFLPLMEKGSAENILFVATGALMSPMSIQQGGSIPSISHLVHLRRIL